MIYELRIYQISPINWKPYIDHYENIALPIVKKYWKPIGFWSSEVGNLFRFHHLWAWESFEERLRLRAALQVDPDWINNYLPLTLPMIEKAENVLLTPTAFCPPLAQ